MQTAFAALLVMMFAVLGATVTGNQEALCKAMGGTYTPEGVDICPGGEWKNIVRPKPTEAK